MTPEEKRMYARHTKQALYDLYTRRAEEWKGEIKSLKQERDDLRAALSHTQRQLDALNDNLADQVEERVSEVREALRGLLDAVAEFQATGSTAKLPMSAYDQDKIRSLCNDK